MARENDQISIFEPRTMGKVISRLAPVRTFFRSTFFNRTKTFNTKSVDYDMKKGNREIAPFVHPRIGGQLVENSGYETKTYTPPLVAPYTITTVEDLETRRAGENIYSGKSPADRAVEKLAEDFTKLREMIIRREEWMCAQAIVKGQIPIVGRGINEVIDFQHTNRVDLSKNQEKKWTSPTSTKIKDIKDWRKTVQKNGLVNCNICIMADDVAEEFANDEKVKSVCDVRGYDMIDRPSVKV